MNYSMILLSSAAILFSLPSMAKDNLTSHQLTFSCNKSSSVLVDSFSHEMKNLKESKRLDLLALVSDACKGGYQSAREGMQYKDIERYLTSTTTDSELPLGLLLSAIKEGYVIYESP